MTKLPLHELLREFANGGSKNDNAEVFCKQIANEEYAIEDGMLATAKNMADEINEYYSQKPVDDSGKPWEIGDECLYYGHEYKVVGYSGHLNVIIQNEPEPEFIFVMGCVIRRPEPQSPIEKLRDEIASYAHSHVPDSVLDGWVKDLDAYIDQQEDK